MQKFQASGAIKYDSFLNLHRIVFPLSNMCALHLHFLCSVSSNFMDSCPIACTVPIMHGTRADITFQNDIFGFGGSALSSVAQNNFWSLRSDGSWHKVLASSPQSHPPTSWPQMVPLMHPLSGRWDGDVLISVGSSDDVRFNSAGLLQIMLYSTSRRVWSLVSSSEVSSVKALTSKPFDCTKHHTY